VQRRGRQSSIVLVRLSQDHDVARFPNLVDQKAEVRGGEG
jgi:hypothetical protein